MPITRPSCRSGRKPTAPIPKETSTFLSPERFDRILMIEKIFSDAHLGDTNSEGPDVDCVGDFVSKENFRRSVGPVKDA